MFAIDGDRSRVVWRDRKTPSYRGKFSYWTDFPTPVGGTPDEGGC
jgi:hypothetical protein